MRLKARAPAKVNLSLFLGGPRADGRHELVTVFESVSLADDTRLRTLEPDAGADQVVCPSVTGPNLVSVALERLRAGGWAAPPVRIEIDKRIPIAGGMAGGSADAAAVLRMASELEQVPQQELQQIAAELGADVPSQLEPGLVLGAGAGEVVEPIAPIASHAFLIVPQLEGRSTAEVYREADRLALSRPAEVLGELRAELAPALRPGARPPAELLTNDLEQAAISLCPQIADALEAVRAQGADHAMVCGSGPTVIGLYWGEEAESRASLAARLLSGIYPGAMSALPAAKGFGAPIDEGV